MLEPELVEGKPTVTMPHLEIGDSIDIERILIVSEPDPEGAGFVSPRWFFREQGVAYDTSEYVIVAPSWMKLDIDASGLVPPAMRESRGDLQVLRWIARDTVPLPDEPRGAPMSEILPSVRAGWGLARHRILQSLMRHYDVGVPPDPRLRQQAMRIAGTGSERERLQRLFDHCVDKIDPNDEELDPRRILTEERGEPTLAFVYLARLVGFKATVALVPSVLASPTRSPWATVDSTEQPLVLVEAPHTTLWVVPPSSIQATYGPSAHVEVGYVPESLEGQNATLLTQNFPERVVRSQGQPDTIDLQIRAHLNSQGVLKGELTQVLRGRYAYRMRADAARIPGAERARAIENQIVAKILPGSTTADVTLDGLDQSDTPVVLHAKWTHPHFAQVEEGGLSFSPPSPVRFGSLVALQERETPLIVDEDASTHSRITMTISLDRNARLEEHDKPRLLSNGVRKAWIFEETGESSVTLRRAFELAPTRLAPDEYPAFREFALRTEDATRRPIRLRWESQ